MKKFLFFCGLVVFMTVLLTMPAAAFCDDCLRTTEDIDWDSHCTSQCSCVWDICGSCGDSTWLDVFCDAQHDMSWNNYFPADCTDGKTYYDFCAKCDFVIYHDPSSPPLGHDYRLKQVSASCDTDGYNYQECSRCNDSYRTTTIPATGHTWKETSRDPASCQETGKIYLECSSCGETSAETIDIIPHDYKTTIVEPTCQGAGYSYHECTMCGHNYNSASKPQLPHTFVEKSRDPATCTQTGTVYLECSCGETSTDILAKSDHEYQNGKCSSCGASDPNYIPPHTHDYNSVVTAPTCTDEGYTTYTCNCGDSYTSDRKNPTGHSYVLGVCRKCGADDPDYEPPCDHDYEDGECTECGALDPDYVPPCSHNYQSSVTPPTCTDGGYTTNTCSKCGDTYTSTPTNPTGHSYEDGECTECGASDPDYTPACDHNYTSVVTPPICTANGYTTYTCTKCGNSYISDYTYTNEHVFQNGKCIHCNVSADTDECTHDYGSAITPPTCHSKGFTTFTCKKCGDAYVDNYTDEIPHKFMFQEEVKAQCGIAGHKYYICGNAGCSEDKYEPIPALEHDWTLIGTEFFEDNTGIATYKCSKCKETKTETIYTQASQAENWLLTAIRGFSGALIQMYETVANGVEIGGVTLEEVIAGCLILVVMLCFLNFAGGWFMKK